MQPPLDLRDHVAHRLHHHAVVLVGRERVELLDDGHRVERGAELLRELERARPRGERVVGEVGREEDVADRGHGGTPGAPGRREAAFTRRSRDGAFFRARASSLHGSFTTPGSILFLTQLSSAPRSETDPCRRAPEVKRQKIVVVEDEPDILEVIEYNLTREGFRVITARDGGDGLKKARSELPDLLVLDLMLPGIDGLEVCRRLRADDVT